MWRMIFNDPRSLTGVEHQRNCVRSKQEVSKIFKKLKTCLKKSIFSVLIVPKLVTVLQDKYINFKQLHILCLCRILLWHKYLVFCLGDGNCLLHAVSLFLWGVEDRDLLLRRLLYLTLANDPKNMYRTRWLKQYRNSVLDSPDLQLSLDSKVTSHLILKVTWVTPTLWKKNKTIIIILESCCYFWRKDNFL